MATRLQIDRLFNLMRNAGVVWNDPTTIANLRNIGNNMTKEELLAEMRKTNEYKARYPAFEQVSQTDPSITTEAQYRQRENQYKNVISKWVTDPNLATRMTDTNALGNLMIGDVSVAEVNDRLWAADNMIKNAPDQYKTALRNYYGIEDGDMLAFLVAPDETKPYLDNKAQEMMRSVTLGVKAARAGIDLTADQVAMLSGDVAAKYKDWTSASMTEDIQKTMSEAQVLAKGQSRLAGIEGEQYNPFEAVQAATGNVQAQLASQKRAEREKARFSGTSAIGSTSLNVSRNI